MTILFCFFVSTDSKSKSLNLKTELRALSTISITSCMKMYTCCSLQKKNLRNNKGWWMGGGIGGRGFIKCQTFFLVIPILKYYLAKMERRRQASSCWTQCEKLSIGKQEYSTQLKSWHCWTVHYWKRRARWRRVAPLIQQQELFSPSTGQDWG